MKQPNLVRFVKLVNPRKIDDAHATLTLKQVEKDKCTIVYSASSSTFKHSPAGRNYYSFKQGTYKGVQIWRIYRSDAFTKPLLCWKFYSINFVKPEEANRLLLLEEL